MTQKDAAMRTVWEAGRYLRAQYLQTSKLAELDSLEWAMQILAIAYNEILGEGHVSGTQ